LIDVFGGKVPQTMEELVTLPGVGRKTANIVLWAGYGKLEGIAVDTHVFRVSRRLGLARGNNPEKVEKELLAIVDKPKWGVFTDILIWHGRRVCDARKPACSTCVLFNKKLCPQVGVTKFA
jgi:endonuclease-3